MKRPPGLWLLLSAGVLWMSLQSVYGLRATELIFGKSTSTTSTTEAVLDDEEAKDGASTEPPESEGIKSNLTGNPQLDYLFDPNLPRELNGYNLSSYPFYNSMPADIDFKCDGLHDGFYASVPHKCQVYHQCLFGTRYDFLCANYTAFDQKTFICHFVSEVDCINSHKYWHRNDALYQAASTTTTKATPIVISPALTAVPRRPPPAVRTRRPSRRRPQYEYYDDDYDVDEREDYYEEPRLRPRRRKRPRPRPRPVYEDDYEDYEDERHDRTRPRHQDDDDDRAAYDRRAPYDRRGELDDRRAVDSDRKPYDRREPDDRHAVDKDRKPYDRREPDDRHSADSDRKLYDRREPDDRRASDTDRKPFNKRDPSDHPSSDTGRKSNDRKEQSDRRAPDNDRKHDRREPDDRHDVDPDEPPAESDTRKPYDRREHDDRRSGVGRKPYDRREYDDRPSEGKRYKDDRRRDYDDRRYDRDDETDYRYDRDRRGDEERKRRPSDDDRYERDDRRSSQDKHPLGDRRSENRRPLDDSRPYDRPRKSNRRPYDDNLYDDDRYYDRPRKNDKKDDPPPHDNKGVVENDGKVLVKQNSSSSLFGKPRTPPQIRPPVPKSEQNKYSFKPTTDKPSPKKPEDEEYYEDYEEEPLPKRTTPRPTPKPEVTENRRPTKPSNPDRDERKENRRPLGLASRPRVQMFKRPVADTFEDYEDDKPKPTRPQTRPRHDLDNRNSKSNSNNRNRPSSDETLDTDQENEKSSKNPVTSRDRNTNSAAPKFVPKDPRARNDPKDRPRAEITSSTRTTTSTTTTTTTTTAAPPTTTITTTTTTKELPKERPEPVVRVVKRPFLPSRGGNPFSSRGLQPVGAKALDNERNLSPPQEEDPSAIIESKYNLETEAPLDTHRPVSTYHPETIKPVSEEYDEPKQSYRPNIVPLRASEEDEESSYKSAHVDETDSIQNGRRFPSEHKAGSFLINEQPVDNYKRGPAVPETSQKDESYEAPFKGTQIKEPETPEEKPAFKPSPVLIKVPIRLKYSNPVGTEDEEEFRPVSNRPQTTLRGSIKHKTYQEPRTTEKASIPERNPLDITENEYDVTLNDALNPTIPNLPVRNFPTGFSAGNDYTFSTFHRPRYDVTLNQASENRYQVRAPSQRVETVVQPYTVNGVGKKYVNTNAQYNIAPEQIYHNQNFRSSPQITQAQTHAFYPIY